MRGRFSLAVVCALFAAGVAVGAALVGDRFQFLASSAMTMMASYVDQIAENKVVLATMLFFKNVLVMVTAMFAGEIFSRVIGLKWSLFGSSKSIAERTKKAAGFFGRLVPVFVLVANAVVLAAVSRVLLESGTRPLFLLASLGPHGVFELAALLWACSSGIASMPSVQKRLILIRGIVPLLAVAAVIEVWVTPVVMLAVA